MDTVVATRQELQLLSLIVDGASPYRSPEKTEEPVSILGIALPPSSSGRRLDRAQAPLNG
jgi:hypothetical protein